MDCSSSLTDNSGRVAGNRVPGQHDSDRDSATLIVEGSRVPGVGGDTDQMMLILPSDSGQVVVTGRQEDSSTLSSGLVMPAISSHMNLSAASSIMEGETHCPVTNKFVKYYYQDLMPGHALQDRESNSVLPNSKGDNSSELESPPGSGGLVARLSQNKESVIRGWVAVSGVENVKGTMLVPMQAMTAGGSGSITNFVKAKNSEASSTNSVTYTAKTKKAVNTSSTVQGAKVIQVGRVESNVPRLQTTASGGKTEDYKIIIVNQPQSAALPVGNQSKAGPSPIAPLVNSSGFKKKTAAILRPENDSKRELDQNSAHLEHVMSLPVGNSLSTQSLALNPLPLQKTTASSVDLSKSYELVSEPKIHPLMKARQQPEPLTEKTYEDSHLPGHMLACMWSLREKNQLCDAVIHVGGLQIKVHKLVLASVSPVVQQQLCRQEDPALTDEKTNVIHIRLPDDLDLEVVKSFVAYLYFSHLKISVSSVTDLYRISTMFQLDQLKKDCYDFCKLAKRGHLIIDVHPERLQFSNAAAESDYVDMDGGLDESATPEVDPVQDVIQSLQPPDTLQFLQQSEEVASESQRNIPIRKRNRSRKSETIVQQSFSDKENSDHKVPVRNDGNYEISSTNPEALRTSYSSFAESSHVTTESSAGVPENLLSQVQAMEKPGPLGPGCPRSRVQTRSQGRKKNEAEEETASKAMNKESLYNGKQVTPKKGPKRASDDHPDPVNDLTNLDILLSAAETPDIDEKTGIKKGRQRKAQMVVEEPPKDEVVYMRPPPKKRTKEIRAMMQHENNDDFNSIKMSPISSVPVTLTDSPLRKGIKAKHKSKRRTTTANVEDSPVLLEKADELSQMVLAMSDTSTEKHFKCNFCQVDFVFAKRIVTHIHKTHEVDMQDILQYVTIEDRVPPCKVCDICGYTVKDNSLYYIHYHKYFKHGIPLPQGWKPFTCDLCSKEFFTKFQLRDHKLIHFEDTPFICEHCGQGFKSRTCLNSHVFHRHNSVRRHKCTECIKTFKTRTQMLVHVRTHTGERPFHCSECNYKSTTRGNMRLHLVNRHKYGSEKVKELMKQLKSVILIEDDPEVEGIETDLSGSPVKTLTIDENPPVNMNQGTQTGSTGKYLPVLQSAAENEVHSLPFQQEVDSNQQTGDDHATTPSRSYSQMVAGVASSSGPVLTEPDLQQQVQVYIRGENGENQQEVQIFIPSYQGNSGPDAVIQSSQDGRKEVVSDIHAGSRMLMRDIHNSDTRGLIHTEDAGQDSLPIGSIIPVSETQVVQIPPTLFQEVQNLGMEGKAQDLTTAASVTDTRAVIHEMPRVDNSQLTPMTPLMLKAVGGQHMIDQAGPPPPSYQQAVLSPDSPPQTFLETSGSGINLPNSVIPPVSSGTVGNVDNVNSSSNGQLTLTSQAYDIVASQASSTSQYTDPAMMIYQYYNPNYQQEY